MRNYWLASFVGVVLLLSSCSPSIPEDVKEVYKDLPQELDFNIHVKPILSDKCFLCHGPDKAKQQAGLRLDLPEGAYGELPQHAGLVAITPGNLNKSQVFHRIISDDPEIMMPSPESKLELTAYEKAVLIKWIEEGAKYKPHWAFIKPEKRNPPKVEGGWARNPIDQFVQKKQKTKKLMPSGEASKELVLRRLSFDLTGLPPTLEEINAFLGDNSSDAYEKQVDRLLASPHFGEKMAVDWMDLSRYADTYGYQVDRFRDTSPWRDWVINSFNENMPYDQFAKWQLAGDLMPNPTKEQLLATGFNRLHPQNMEGGIIDEEFRVEYVADRTNVVGQGFMALTMGCAKCHDHKFDPISQKNFFEFYSFFNNQNETGQISWDPKDIPVPNMLLPNEQQEKVIEYLKKEVKRKEDQLASVQETANKAFENWLETGGLSSVQPQMPTKGLVGRFELDGKLSNSMKPGQVAKIDRQFSKHEVPDFAEGKKGKGLLMNGDAWLDLDPVGVYKRNEPFSISIWVNVPKELSEGVIFHKNKGTRLHSYKGYHLNIKDNKIEVMLAHTWPDNAIVEVSEKEIPKEEWVHLMMTYDGSSKAGGLRIYMNGEDLVTKVEVDNLYKDIIYNKLVDQIYDKAIEPGLQVGARWRGKGIGGARVDEVSVYSRELSAIEVMMIGNKESLMALIGKTKSSLSAQESRWLEDYYMKNVSREYQNAMDVLTTTRRQLVDSIEQVQEVMVMKEMTEPRKAYILERGQYDAYGEEVFPNTPESVLPWKDKYEKNRLGLAEWLFDEDHPLTARVAVNRYWQNYFGRGLVRTTEDFGNQGEMPSHPELLDWLAIAFMESGWDVKALQKLIVMSATYRQSSVASQEMREKDPQNIYLARGPKTRLSSEMMRDNALVASGLINDKIGGKSIKPYQPEGLWTMNADTYVQSTGEELYRRSLYVYWKRTVSHPTLSTFDQPERVECMVRRQKTNTPLQALVLLNDRAYVEISKVMGEKITRELNQEEAISRAYQSLTGIQPKKEELAVLLRVQADEYQQFKNDSNRSKGWLEAGEYKIDKSLDTNMVAANAVVASVILNSDASITKR